MNLKKVSGGEFKIDELLTNGDIEILDSSLVKNERTNTTNTKINTKKSTTNFQIGGF